MLSCTLRTVIGDRVAMEEDQLSNARIGHKSKRKQNCQRLTCIRSPSRSELQIPQLWHRLSVKPHLLNTTSESYQSAFVGPGALIVFYLAYPIVLCLLEAERLNALRRDNPAQHSAKSIAKQRPAGWNERVIAASVGIFIMACILTGSLF